MRLLLRALPMLMIYAVLAGPAEPGNWLVGTLAGLALSAALPGPGGGRSGAGPLRLAGRALLLPWFLLGVLGRIAAGSWTMIRTLIAGRGRFGFVRSEAHAETPHGQVLLAIVETASPSSIVAEVDEGGMRTSLLEPEQAESHAAGQRRWYRRFQRPMLP